MDEVNTVLKELKTVEGKGSKDKKLYLIASSIETIHENDQIRIFLRIISKKLRIGIANKSIKFDSE